MGLWLGKVLDGLDLVRKWRDTVAVNMMTKKVQLGSSKCALVRIDDYAMVREVGKHGPEVSEVLLWGGASNENVIDIGIR